jgi:hypothetical protein
VRKNSGCFFGYHSKGDFVSSLRYWSRNAGNMKPLFVGFSRDIVLLEMLVLDSVGEIASYPSLTFSSV